MLPTLALVQNEKVRGYVVGLDDVGGREDFATDTLAGRLAQDSMIFWQGPQQQAPGQKVSSIRKREADPNDEDSDFES